jgi:ElaB/YqjD/DUF883 family membrane-anchored ribosome-binding protein
MSAQRKSDGNAGNNHRPRIGDRIVEIQDSAQHLLTEARAAVTDIREALDVKSRVERHPYAMLGAAAAIGYVLGGGLFTPLTASLLRLGIRLAAIPLVKSELVGIAEGVLGDWTQNRTRPQANEEKRERSSEA